VGLWFGSSFLPLLYFQPQHPNSVGFIVISNRHGSAILCGLRGLVPSLVIVLLGTAGLIMIVLEAGLDLEINRSRLPIIFNAFMSALVIFLISSFSIAGIIFAWISDTPFIHCLIYAIPLSIVSSAVVLTSVHHLGPEKKEFLIY
jgi:hypothetical protein